MVDKDFRSGAISKEPERKCQGDGGTKKEKKDELQQRV